MAALRSFCAVIAAALVSSCSYYDQLFGPSGSSDAISITRTGPAAPQPAPASAAAMPSPAASNAAAALFASPAGGNTGTFVGQKVRDLRGDLQRVTNSLNQRQQDLQQTRLALVRDASAYSADVSRLNAISSATAGDASLAAYLLESARSAATVQGGNEQDQRDLAQLESQIGQAQTRIAEFRQQLAAEISRQSSYLGYENTDLASVAGRGPLAAAPASAGAFAARNSTRRPLVVIRFDKPNVAYEQALYNAVSRALQRAPSANFDLVAVAPDAESSAQVAANAEAAKRNTESVMHSLASMGLPPDRLTLSATTSGEVQSNEVRLYVR